MLERKEDRSWREEIEDERRPLVGDPGRRAHQVDADPINPQLVFHELSRAPARRRHPDRRLRLGDELVGAPPAAAPRDGRRAVAARWRRCARRCPTRSRRSSPTPSRPVDRVPRRRRDADARHQRADRRRPLRRPLERSAARRARAQQQRPQPGHLGAARHGRRPEARGLAGPPRLPFAALRASCSACGASGSRARTTSARHGTRALAAERPVRDRRRHRPGGAAAAAAHPHRAGQGLRRERSRKGDPASGAHRPPVDAGEAQGSRHR